VRGIHARVPCDGAGAGTEKLIPKSKKVRLTVAKAAGAAKAAIPGVGKK